MDLFKLPISSGGEFLLEPSLLGRIFFHDLCWRKNHQICNQGGLTFPQLFPAVVVGTPCWCFIAANGDQIYESFLSIPTLLHNRLLRGGFYVGGGQYPESVFAVNCVLAGNYLQ